MFKLVVCAILSEKISHAFLFFSCKKIWHLGRQDSTMVSILASEPICQGSITSILKILRRKINGAA